MVVMAIVAVLLTLTGGIMQQNIAKQERVVELEKVTQLFNQLAYQSYYGKGPISVRLQESIITVEEPMTVVPSDESNQSKQSQIFIKEINFNQLTFVAQDYTISSKGIVSPNTFGIILKNEIKHFPFKVIFNEISK